MNEDKTKLRNTDFHELKIVKKELLTKNSYLLELEVPTDLKNVFAYQSGQYLTFRILRDNNLIEKDFSIVSAPFEENLAFGVKIKSEKSFANIIFTNYQVTDYIEVSAPKGRFILKSKPHEFRTILGFAMGIGITPILSHVKNILHIEPRSRIFLFYGSRTSDDIIFKKELDNLDKIYGERLQVFYFLSKEEKYDALFSGRIDRKKIKLIINQILNLDDTDEESTIWDSVDEVLICGNGEMIREVANACHDEGIPKQNIHFELFEEFNEDIYVIDKSFQIVENIAVEFQLNNQKYTTTLENNKERLLQSLIAKKFTVSYSCKSGICGSCICHLDEGKVEVLENEYLTKNEEAAGKILACRAVILSENVKINFDV